MKKKYNILLIEPDAELADTIKEWLKSEASITHVTDKENAQQQALRTDWHLVITDINLSGINDLDVTQIVKKANSSTALLIISENIKVDFILTAMKYHADGLFFKPLDKNEFTTRALQLAEEAKLKIDKAKKIILAIGAHPDDIEFGCGGTLAKFKAEGNELHLLTLSSGASGGNPQRRKKEAEKAALLQGATLILGDFKDTKITSSVETIQFIESVVQQINPTHVYTHSFYDNHQDHRSTYQATVIACRPISNLFSYLSPSSTIDFSPNIFINIDQFIEEKLRIISSYTSQIETRPYLHPDLIRATARYWGRFANYTLVEPMEVIKEQL